ncbi:MAG: TraR/DksA family transcriptional regulator [Planctomycetota bacterium]
MPRRLKKADLDYFRKLLLEYRKALVGDLNHMEEGALRRSKDNAATLDISNFADLGSDYFEQDVTIGLIENSEATVREIDAALQRIEDGTYGQCEEGGHVIPKARLRVIPWARLCVQCQRKLEEEEARAQ